MDNSLIRGFHGTLFGRKIAPNSTSNTPSSGNILADSSGATQFDGILKEEHILLFVPCLFDGITAWTIGRGITAYIYYRSGLIRLGLLCPDVKVYQLGLCALWLSVLLNKLEPTKATSEPYGNESMRKIHQRLWNIQIKWTIMDSLDPKDVQLQSVTSVAARLWKATLSMCKMAAAVLRHVKLQHFIKGPEMRLKHTTASERSGKKAQRKVDRRSEWLISSDAEKSPWTYCISLYAEAVLEPSVKAWKARVTATLNHSETLVPARESSQTALQLRSWSATTPRHHQADQLPVYPFISLSRSLSLCR